MSNPPQSAPRPDAGLNAKGLFVDGVLPNDVIDRIKAGESAALNEWLTSQRERLAHWTAINVRVPAGRGSDFSDIVQEACAYLAFHIRNFRGNTEAELVAWLRNIVRCRAIDLSRKRVLHTFGHDSEAASDAGTPALSQLAADITTPSQQAIRNENEQQLLDAADSLSDEQLLIVLLREIDGCRLKMIAREIDRPAVEVARLFYQGLQQLSELPAQWSAALELTQPETPRGRLKRALRQLPERQRQAVELKHVEEYSLEEIAIVLDCKPRTAEAAGSLVYRGVAKLKGCLQG